MDQSPRLRDMPGGANCFLACGVQQQDRAVGGRVPVPAGLTRTRLPLVSRRAAPRPPAARAGRLLTRAWRNRTARPPVTRKGAGSSPAVPAGAGWRSPVVLGGLISRRSWVRIPPLRLCQRGSAATAPVPYTGSARTRGFESHRWLCDRSSNGEHEAVNLGTWVRFPPVTSPSSGAAGSARGSGPRAAGSNPACSTQSG